MISLRCALLKILTHRSFKMSTVIDILDNVSGYIVFRPAPLLCGCSFVQRLVNTEVCTNEPSSPELATLYLYV